MSPHESLHCRAIGPLERLLDEDVDRRRVDRRIQSELKQQSGEG